MNVFLFCDDELYMFKSNKLLFCSVLFIILRLSCISGIIYTCVHTVKMEMAEKLISETASKQCTDK